MSIESKPEQSNDLQEHNPAEAAVPESVEFRKPLILPPPIPGQTAWSILPW